jgi:hypothetical protein
MQSRSKVKRSLRKQLRHVANWLEENFNSVGEDALSASQFEVERLEFAR